MALEQIGLEAVLQDANFQEGLKRYQDGIKSASDSTERGANIMSQLGGIAQGALVAGLGAATAAFGAFLAASKIGLDSLSQWQEQVHGLQKVLGGTGEQMSAWATAMHHVGLTTEEGAMGLNYFTRQLDDVDKVGTKGQPTINNFTKALDKLGVQAHDSQGKLKTFDSLMPEIMDKFAKLPDGVNASAMAMDMFGARGGSKFLEFLRLGSAGLGDAAEMAKEFGLDLSTAGVDSIEEYNRSLNDLGLGFTGIKNQIGMAVLPYAQKLVELVRGAIPRFIEWGRAIGDILGKALSIIAPIIEKVALGISNFIIYLRSGMDPLHAIRILLYTVFPPDLAEKINGIVLGISDFISQVQIALAPITEWISQNVQLRDLLTAFGIVIASIVIPALVSTIAAIAPVVLAIVGLIAAVTLVREAWETDWGGIRTTLTNAWTNTLQPALSALWQWLQVNIPIAIQALSNFWTNTLLPALAELANFWTTTLYPALSELWTWLATNIPAAIQTVSDFWTNTLQPALQTVWDFIEANILPTLQVVWDWLATNIPDAVSFLVSKWLEGWGKISDFFSYIWNKIVKPIFEEWKAGIASIISAVGTLVSWINDAIDAMNKLLGKQKTATSSGGSSGGGERQGGGPVEAGVAYTVGERGPETFIPKVNGQIIPHGSAASITNVYNSYRTVQISMSPQYQNMQSPSSVYYDVSAALMAAGM